MTASIKHNVSSINNESNNRLTKNETILLVVSFIFLITIIIVPMKMNDSIEKKRIKYETLVKIANIEADKGRHFNIKSIEKKLKKMEKLILIFFHLLTLKQTIKYQKNS